MFGKSITYLISFFSPSIIGTPVEVFVLVYMQKIFINENKYNFLLVRGSLSYLHTLLRLQIENQQKLNIKYIFNSEIEPKLSSDSNMNHKFCCFYKFNYLNGIIQGTNIIYIFFLAFI